MKTQQYGKNLKIKNGKKSWMIRLRRKLQEAKEALFKQINHIQINLIKTKTQWNLVVKTQNKTLIKSKSKVMIFHRSRRVKQFKAVEERMIC